MPFDAKDLDLAEEQNRARFLELCCVWIGRNFKDYFETILVVSDIISRLAIPEPRSKIFSVKRRLPSHLFDPPSHTYRILLRCWPDQKILIAQTTQSFQESKELDYEQIDNEFDDLEYRLGWVKKAILRQHENLADYVGYWRRPQAGYHSKYNEHWTQFLGAPSNRRGKRFTGQVVIDLLYRFAQEEAQTALREFEDILVKTFRKKDLRAMYDWACFEDGRIVVTEPPRAKTVKKYQWRP